jgi:hypothetical protein
MGIAIAPAICLDSPLNASIVALPLKTNCKPVNKETIHPRVFERKQNLH